MDNLGFLIVLSENRNQKRNQKTKPENFDICFAHLLAVFTKVLFLEKRMDTRFSLYSMLKIS